MNKFTETENTEKNLPLFVTIYEILYKRIKDGIYKPGDKLPSENQLALELNVSRGTLRQAMLLLQEDGLIISHKGKGSFVLSGPNELSQGIEKTDNPMLTCNTQPIDKIVTEIQFQPATDRNQQLFDIEPSSLIALMEFKYYVSSEVAGLAMVFMPYDLFAEHNVPLNSNNAIHQFYTNFLRTDMLSSESIIRIGYPRQSIAEKMNLNEDDAFLLMDEMFFLMNHPVMLQKLFFRPTYYELKLLRRHDRYTSK